MQLIMINELTSTIAAFAIGWLGHAILLRLGKPARPSGIANLPIADQYS
jgi:hypothetical protein